MTTAWKGRIMKWLTGYTKVDATHLLVVAVDLLGTGDVQVAQLWLHLGVDLQLEQSLADGPLKLIGLPAAGLDDFVNEHFLEEGRDWTR